VNHHEAPSQFVRRISAHLGRLTSTTKTVGRYCHYAKFDNMDEYLQLGPMVGIEKTGLRLEPCPSRWEVTANPLQYVGTPVKLTQGCANEVKSIKLRYLPYQVVQVRMPTLTSDSPYFYRRHPQLAPASRDNIYTELKDLT
jgi:hypothetical protein